MKVNKSDMLEQIATLPRRFHCQGDVSMFSLVKRQGILDFTITFPKPTSELSSPAARNVSRSGCSIRRINERRAGISRITTKDATKWATSQNVPTVSSEWPLVTALMRAQLSSSTSWNICGEHSSQDANGDVGFTVHLVPEFFRSRQRPG